MDANVDALTMSRVVLRPVSPADLRQLTRMAIAFNDEDGHPLSAASRRAVKMLCAGTPHGLAFMIERGGRPVGYVVVGLGFSIEYGGVDGFLDEFYVEEADRGAGVGSARVAATAHPGAAFEDPGAAS